MYEASFANQILLRLFLILGTLEKAEYFVKNLISFCGYISHEKPFGNWSALSFAF